MKKSILTIALFVGTVTFCYGQQAQNHLKNNGLGQTFFKTTNANSTNGGLRIGIESGDNQGNNGFINLRENRSLLFSTFDAERLIILATGNVGIAQQTPLTSLHVGFNNGGDGLITSDALVSPFNYTYAPGDGMVIANGDGTLNQKINFTGNTTDVLLGNGQFGTIPTGGNEDHDWYDVALPNTSPTDINNSIYTFGQVGIGLLNPNASLSLRGDNSVNNIFDVVNEGSQLAMRIDSTAHVGFGVNPSLNERVFISGLPGVKYGAQIFGSNMSQGGAGLRVRINNADSPSNNVQHIGISVDQVNGNPASNNQISTGFQTRLGYPSEGYSPRNAYGFHGSVTGGTNITAGVYGITGGSQLGAVYSTGVLGQNLAATGCADKRAGTFIINNNRINNSTNYGVHTQVVVGGDSSVNYGLFSSANVNALGINNANAVNIGGYFEALRGAVNNAIVVPQGGGSVIIGAAVSTVSSFELDVYGDIAVNNAFQLSDENFKTEIEPLEKSLDYLKKINAYSYKFKSDEFPNRNFDNNLHHGVIAQEVEEVFPHLVKTNKDGYKAVNYVELIPLLIESVKELSAEVDVLKQEISFAERSTSAIDAISINAKLYQNTPNPFKESTVIRYELPEKYEEAAIYIYDMQGTQLKKIEITDSDNDEVVIDGNALNSGMFLYSLIIDNQEIDTKRMILTN